MDRRTTLLALVALPLTGAFTMPALALADATPSPDADIHAWLADHAAAWNANDVAAMFARAAPDLHWVNVVGMHWQGLDQVVQAHQVFFSIMFNNVPLTLLGVDSVVEIAPGTRVCVARWAIGDYSTPSGQRILGETNRMTLIFTGRDQAVLLRHVANIRIDTEASAHDPVNRSD